MHTTRRLFLDEYCFVHNGGWYLAKIRVFEGGIIDCWGAMNREKFLKETGTGWITVDIPDGEELRIGDQGFIVKQAETLKHDGSLMFKHRWINQEDFVKAVLDAEHTSRGNKSAGYLCVEAFDAYLANQTDENREKLRRAYFDVPSQKRRYLLGDQDLKDFPIRTALGI